MKHAALMLLLCAAMAQGQDTAKGFVYHDANGNGARDGGEAGVPGVAVSNGRDVVRTGSDGAWSLPVTDDTGLFVVKPAGWAVPVDEMQIPQHYYIHKPAGSPELVVPGVEPTGPLPASIDFPLTKWEEPEDYTVLLFGDPQTRGLREVNFVAHDVIAEVIGTDALFGITLGDIVADDAGLFSTIADLTSKIGIPWYNVFGNHDSNRDGERSTPDGRITAPDDRYSDETFERVYGPSTIAFEYGKVSYIILENVYYKPDSGYEGRFTDDQVAFVNGYLEGVPNDNLVILLMHIPILRAQNREALFDAIDDRPNTLSIAAHTHTLINAFIDEQGGWKGKEPHHHFVNGTVCGSWWCGTFDERGIPHATMNDGAPNGYAYLHIDGPSYKIHYKPAGRPADYQMNVHLPDEVTRAELTNTTVLANIFNGTERSTVEMTHDGGKTWTPMEMKPAIDPLNKWMEEISVYLDTEVDGKKLSSVFGYKMDPARPIRHMWQAPMPTGLDPGAHLITVRTTDMYGYTWTGNRLVRVLE